MANEIISYVEMCRREGVSLQRGMNIPPTLEIRPGYQFNVMVTNDLVLPGPYRN